MYNKSSLSYRDVIENEQLIIYAWWAMASATPVSVYFGAELFL